MSLGSHRAASFVLVIALASVLPALPAAAAVIDNAAGPLTRVEVTPDLNCAVDHTLDTRPSFFQGTACATLIAKDGQLYGPAAIPGSRNPQPRTTFTVVGQTSAGSGTNADPFTITTRVALPDGSLELTQVDSYVVGEESYRTDVNLANPGPAPADGVLYRAGDCQLGDSDAGYGRVDAVPEGTAVACRGGDASGPGDRIIQFLPLTPGSSFMQAFYGSVWNTVAAGLPFPDTCECDVFDDNGAGLSWSFSLPPGASATYSNLITFSPEGRLPLSLQKAVSATPVEPGTPLTYDITISNPNVVDVTVDSLVDDLPPDFTYTAGTTTGVTTADPAIAGQSLTWAGPLVVPASGSVQLAFDATAGSTLGTYPNEVGATASGFTVTGTGPVAAVEVIPGNPPRIPGGNVTRVAINMCQFLFTAPDSARTVVVARNDVFADALAGAPLLADDSCLVVTDGGPDVPLNAESRAEIDRVLANGGLVRLAGGINAVSTSVETELDNAGYQVERFAGNTRYETAALIAREVAQERPGATQLMLASAGQFPDAVTGGAYGAYAGVGIVLTDRDTLDAQAAGVIRDLGIQEVIVLGGDAAVSTAVESSLGVPSTRYQGPNRMGTAADVAGRLWPTSLPAPATAVVVTNLERPDGWVLTLASAPLSARQAAPQVGVAADRYPTETQQLIQGLSSSLRTPYIVGDATAVSDQVAAQIRADIP